MKKIKYFMICLLSAFSLVAQEGPQKATRKADRAYAQFSYSKAARIYESYLPSKDSAYIYERLASSYLHLNQPQHAEPYLAKLVSINEIDPRYYYEYAEVLSSEGKYGEADEWYVKYNHLKTDDERVQAKLGALENMDVFFKDSARYTLQSVAFNSEGLDFSPAYYDEGVVFASSRPSFKLVGRRKFNWDKSPFLDLYYGKPGESEADYFSGELNSVFHEGPLDFYANETKLVFTRNNQDVKNLRNLNRDKVGVVRLKLFFTEKRDQWSKWSKPVPFKYNSDAYSVGHPTISEDGMVMVFASDMPGTEGQSDLFISYFKDGNWTEPANLGTQINSAGRESFPSMVGNKLYFASDGHGGIGGLDIFSVDFENYQVGSAPANLGYPINTSKDDFGFITTEDFKEGYFTSSREAASKDDIYYFERTELNLLGRVYDLATNEPIFQADVFMYDSVAQTETYARSNPEGEFILPEFDKAMLVTAGKYNYVLVDTVRVNSETNDEIKVFLKRLDEDNKDKYIMASDTNEVMSIANDDLLLIEPIYYDFDRFNLRNVSENQLDRVALFLTKYPEVQLELASHTDSRGDRAYNLILSSNRAKEALEYLKDLGIDPSRLKPMGYGENQLVNDCQDGDPCSDQQHQLNRRTEFIIVGRN